MTFLDDSSNNSLLNDTVINMHLKSYLIDS